MTVTMTDQIRKHPALLILGCALICILLFGEESDVAITGLSLLGVYSLLLDFKDEKPAQPSTQTLVFMWMAILAIALFFIYRTSLNPDAIIQPIRLLVGAALLTLWTWQEGQLVLPKYGKALAILFLLAIPDEVFLFSIMHPLFNLFDSPTLAQLTAIFAENVASLAGLPVHLYLPDSQIISPTSSVTVWGPCDGGLTMDFMLKLSLMLVLVFGIELKKWLPIVLLAVAVAFVVNGLRIALLVYFAHQHQINMFDLFHEGMGNIVFALTPIGLLMVYAFFQMDAQTTRS